MTIVKKTSFALVFVFFSISLFSQNAFGVRAGITIPNQTYEQDGIDISFDSNLGLSIAAFLELGLSDNFAIQPEIAFVQKGVKNELEIFGETFESKIRLNHIDVPILAKVKFGNDAIAAFVAAGPSLGYAISGADETDGEKEKFEDEDWEGYKRFELGGVVAGGAGIALESGGQVFLDLRYFLSLSNLNDTEEDITAKNKGVGISLGYLMPF